MKKLFASAFLCIALMVPALAVAPAIVLSIVTSGATYSTVPTAASAAGTIITAVTLTGAALISAAGKAIKIFWPPTNGAGAAPATAVYAEPGTATSSQLTNSCTAWIRIDELFNTTSTIGGYDWKVFASTVSCSNWGSYDNASVSDSCNGNYNQTCAVRVTSYKMTCKTAAGCGLIQQGQAIESTDNAIVLEQQRQLHRNIEDNQIRLSNNGGVISYDLGDMQLPTIVGGETGYPAPIQGGGMALQYTNNTGQNSVLIQQPNPDGYTLSDYAQGPDGQVYVSDMAVSNNGTVQSHSTSTKTGYVNPVPQTAPGTSVNYSPITVNNPNPGGDPDPTPDPGTQTPTFPSDYARTGEAANAANTIVNELMTGDVLQPTVDDVDMPWFGSTFDGVLPTINTAGFTCPVWQFDALGESFYIDHHCQLIGDFNALFYSIFTAFWTLLAFRTVLEA